MTGPSPPRSGSIPSQTCRCVNECIHCVGFWGVYSSEPQPAQSSLSCHASAITQHNFQAARRSMAMLAVPSGSLCCQGSYVPHASARVGTAASNSANNNPLQDGAIANGPSGVISRIDNNTFTAILSASSGGAVLNFGGSRHCGALFKVGLSHKFWVLDCAGEPYTVTGSRPSESRARWVPRHCAGPIAGKKIRLEGSVSGIG